MNRKRRKAYKMFRRKYGKAKNVFWIKRENACYSIEAFDAAIRRAFNIAATPGAW